MAILPPVTAIPASQRAEAARPDLQNLVERFGSYSAITSAAWDEWDAAMAAWKANIRHGEFWLGAKK